MILIKIINLDNFDFLKKFWTLSSLSFQKDKLDVNFSKRVFFAKT